jgi:uncharacterized RDD family membrane protein YckC
MMRGTGGGTAANEFRLAGDRTNLYEVVSARAGGDKGEGVFAVRQMDGHGKWSEPEEVGGMPVQTAAWQENLAVMYEGGGLRLFGPKAQAYQMPPARLWWTVALAAADDRLMALGLSAEGKPVFAERGKTWGDVQPVDLVVKWPHSIGATARAAVREGEFHVVWTEPAAESPIGDAPRKEQLHFAWRAAGGKWHGPFEEPTIQPVGPLSVASAGGKLLMIYREGGSAGTEKEPGPLAWAEFTAGDGKWHRVGTLAAPAEGAGGKAAQGEKKQKSPAVNGYGLAGFADGFVAAWHYEDGSGRLYGLDAATGALGAEKALPATAVQGPAEGADSPSQSLGVVLLVGLVVMIVLAAVQYRQQQIFSAKVAAGEISREEAARVVAAQVEKLMYLSVLVRRIAAAGVDQILMSAVALGVTVAAGPALGYAPLEVMREMNRQINATGAVNLAHGQEVLVLFGAALCAAWLVYGTVMEGCRQQTLGKMIFGVIVTDLGGGRPSWWRVVLRNLVRPVDLCGFVVPGLVGLLAIMWSSRSQRLGDMAGGTLVTLRRKPVSGGPWAGGPRAG